MFIGDQRRIVFTGNESGDRVHGTGTIQRDNSGDIFNAMGFQTHAHAGHAAGFHLEHTRGLALTDHFKGSGIILRNLFQTEVRLFLLHRLDGIVQNSEVAQTQKVHFQQTQFFQRSHDVLADYRFIILRQRHIFVYRTLGNHHTGRMGGGVAGHTFQFTGRVDELFHTLIGFIQVRKRLAEPQRIIQRNVQRIGHLLGDDIHISIGHTQHTTHITDHTTGRHGTKGDDLRHMIIAVLAADIIHHLAAASIAEVHINIRHADTLRIQEALEIQAVFHGIHIRDVQAVGHDAARSAAAPGTHGDTAAFCIAHEVRHNEEIIGEAHLLDHVDLIVHLLAVFRCSFTVAGRIALCAQLAQVRCRVISFRQFEFRQMIFAKSKIQIAHIGNLRRIFHSVLIARKQSAHFLFGTKIEVLGFIAHTVFVIHRFTGLDAHEDIVSLRIFLAEIVGVIGTDKRNAGFLMQTQQAAVDFYLFPDAVILQFQIEVLRSEQFRQFQRIGFCVFILAVAQTLGNLAGQTGAQGDQALTVLTQQLHVDSGSDIEPLCPRHGHHIGEIAVAGLILAQQHQMTAFRVKLMLLVKSGTIPGRYIDLTADHRLDALSLAGTIKVDYAVHHAVVGDGTGGLPHLLYHLRKVLDTAGTVQQAELSMDMQVNKGHSASLLPLAVDS